MAESYVKTRRYVPGSAVLATKLGGVLGLASFIILLMVGIRLLVVTVRNRHHGEKDARKL